MPLYLVRHGEAHSRADDPNRSLTDSGKATVHAVAKVAAAAFQASILSHTT